jgi:hypothetical protein
MKQIVVFILLSGLVAGCRHGSGQNLWQLNESAWVFMENNEEGDRGIGIMQKGKPFLMAAFPLHVELSDGKNVVGFLNKGYDEFDFDKDILTARGSVSYGEVVFHFKDTWKMSDSSLQLDRDIHVEGNMDAGFMTGILFEYAEMLKRDSVQLFVPGMIYGTTDYLSSAAIGGSGCVDFVRIREDRIPAPLFGAYFNNGNSLTILNSNPDAQTTKEDSRDNDASTLIDERFRFGAIGADFDNDYPVFGYWYPGSEGGVTYKGRTYPYGQMKKWSRRYHPVRQGFRQGYQVSLRIEPDDSFKNYYSHAWRWAWSNLNPQLNWQDIELARRSLTNMLGENIETFNSITGIRNFIPARKGMEGPMSHKTIMGFCGKTLETANLLLADALDAKNPMAEKHRELGESVIKTFLNLELSPPAGEGFTFEGKPELALPLSKLPEPIVYLRSFGDGLKELLKAARREKEAGIEHEDWINWARTFADWLLPQQGDEGGFPRTWKQGSGEVFDPFPESSYTAIPFLVLLSELTEDHRYSEAALRAGEFCWNTSQNKGVFIGGTIDNPNVIDKEAGTLSLEAYLMLYDLTSDEKWLERAITAANFAETWIYIWDVPMPEAENDEDLHWKKGLTTVGIQLISTGHSLTDQYMGFDVDEFAELYLHTGNRHYYEVARILLHNTKTMLALPGREFDLKGPGWMQEHWSMAPTRGFGIHRGWLPWVSTSQLNGIIELESLDSELYEIMIGP